MSRSPIHVRSARIERGLLVGIALAATLLLAYSPILLREGAYFGMVDHWQQWLPNVFALDSAIDSGELPLWNPLSFCGTPMAGHPLWHPFYPPNLLRSLFVGEVSPMRVHVSLAILAALHVWLAAFGAYLLARDHGQSPPAAMVASLAFVLAAAVTQRVYANQFMVSLAWVPLVLLAARRVIFGAGWTAKLRPAIGGGGAVGLLVLGGSPPIVYYAAVLVACYCLALGATHIRSTGPRRLVSPGQSLVALGVLAVLGALIGAALLVPAAELSSLSPRGRESGVLAKIANLVGRSSALDLPDILQLLTVFPGDLDPDALIDSLRRPRFAGLSVLILAVASLAHRDWRQVVAIAGTFYVFFDASLGPPFLFSVLTEAFAPYAAGSPDRAAVIAAPLLGLLAGFGTDAVTSAGSGRARRFFALGVGLALFAIGLVGMRGGTALSASPVVVAMPILVLAVVALGARVGHKLGRAVLLVFVLGELLAWNVPYLALLAHERGFKGFGRALESPVMWSDNRRGTSDPPNQSLLRLAPAMNGYDPLYLDSVRRVLCRPGAEDLYSRTILAEEVTARSGHGFLFLKRSFWLANRYAVAPLPPKGEFFAPTTTVFLPELEGSLPVPRVEPGSSVRSSVSADVDVRAVDLRVIRAARKRGEVYEFSTPLSGRHSALRVDYSASGRGYVTCLFGESGVGPERGKNQDVRPGRGTFEIPLPDWGAVHGNLIVRTPDTVRLEGARLVADRADEDHLIRGIERRFNSVSLEVGELPEDRILLFVDAHYPGWEAWLDGERVPIHLANDAFKAIHVPRGTHSVRFVFRPARVGIGVAVSLIAFVLSALVLFLLARRSGHEGHPVG